MKEVAITVRMPESVKKKAVRAAKRIDLSLAQYIRKIIKEDK